MATFWGWNITLTRWNLIILCHCIPFTKSKQENRQFCNRFCNLLTVQLKPSELLCSTSTTRSLRSLVFLQRVHFWETTGLMRYRTFQTMGKSFQPVVEFARCPDFLNNEKHPVTKLNKINTNNKLCYQQDFNKEYVSMQDQNSFCLNKWHVKLYLMCATCFHTNDWPSYSQFLNARWILVACLWPKETWNTLKEGGIYKYYRNCRLTAQASWATSKMTLAEVKACVKRRTFNGTAFSLPQFCNEESLWNAIGNSGAGGIGRRVREEICFLGREPLLPPPDVVHRACRLAGPRGLGVRVHTQPDNGLGDLGTIRLAAPPPFSPSPSTPISTGSIQSDSDEWAGSSNGGLRLIGAAFFLFNNRASGHHQLHHFFPKSVSTITAIVGHNSNYLSEVRASWCRKQPLWSESATSQTCEWQTQTAGKQ